MFDNLLGPYLSVKCAYKIFFMGFDMYNQVYVNTDMISYFGNFVKYWSLP